MTVAMLGAFGCAGDAPEPPAPPPTTTPPNEPERPAVPEPCAEELAGFEAEVWRPVLGAQCVGCHQAEGPAARSRMVLQPVATPEALRHNWRAAGAMSILEVEGEPLLLSRPSGRHPEGHPGGALISVDTPEYDALADFVTRARKATCDPWPPPPPVCEGPEFGPPLLRRLTRAEYEASLSALIFAAPMPSGFAADPAADGFDNHARRLTVSALLADQLRSHAELVAERAVLDLDALLPCEPTPELAEACRDLFIRDLGARAFRRPLTEPEQARYRGLFEATADGDFGIGVQWVLTAMLQSPHFLYRSELGRRDGDVNRLDDHEIASELSYFLTGGPPDEVLRRAADQGRLSTPEERDEQAERLLRTPAAQAALVKFFFAWLDLDRLDTVPKDAATYPRFTDEVRTSMRRETERFLEEVLWRSDGTLQELLTAPYTFGDATLEGFYGETGAGEYDASGYRRIESSALHVGLLTQGSLLSTHARANESSPIHRGKLVRERMLCQPLEPPPPGLAAEPPPADPNATTRQRYAAHSEVEPCQSCHRLIDPIGFGFEQYDGVGRYRPVEAGERVDTRGEILDSPSTDGGFEDLAGLAARLGASEDVAACFADRLQRYGYGLDADEGLRCGLEAARAEFEAGGRAVPELIRALVRAPHFATRTTTLAGP